MTGGAGKEENEVAISKDEEWDETGERGGRGVGEDSGTGRSQGVRGRWDSVKDGGQWSILILCLFVELMLGPEQMTRWRSKNPQLWESQGMNIW